MPPQVSRRPLPVPAIADEAGRLELHDACWTARTDALGPGPKLTVVNDMRVDPETRRVTVHAQARVLGRVLSPPKVDPGDCGRMLGNVHRDHPDAVYLDGTGRELDRANGNGA